MTTGNCNVQAENHHKQRVTVHCRVGFLQLSNVGKLQLSNVGKTIINNKPSPEEKKSFFWCYKPFPNGWFEIVLPRLEDFFCKGGPSKSRSKNKCRMSCRIVEVDVLAGVPQLQWNQNCVEKLLWTWGNDATYGWTIAFPEKYWSWNLPTKSRKTSPSSRVFLQVSGCASPSPISAQEAGTQTGWFAGNGCCNVKESQPCRWVESGTKLMRIWWNFTS